MPAQTPTAAELLDLCRRTMAPEYWRMVEADPGGLLAIYEGMAGMFAALARRIRKMRVSGYVLPFGTETEEPATFARRSTCEVDLRRMGNTWRGVSMGAGTVWIDGPQGRRYRNRERIEWRPYGVAEQRVIFEAEYAGWTYDLDFAADEDGLLTEPKVTPAAPWLDLVDLEAPAVRSGSGASIVVTAGQRSVLVDVGAADVLNAGDVGKYVVITDAANVANRGQVLRVIAHRRGVADDPVGSGLRPNTVSLDDVAEPLVLQAAVADDGGVLVVETGGPFTLAPAVPVVGDAYYFGLHAPFVRLDLVLDTAATGDLVVTWERWDGAAWTAFAVVADGSASLAQSGRVEWEIPGAWATTTVSGVVAYWVRARVTTATGATGATATGVYAGVPYGLVSEAGTVSWTLLRWRDLGFVISRITAPTGGRLNTLGMLGAERQAYPVAGETEDGFRQRVARMIAAVSPVAIHSALNRVLSPYGLRGRVMDVQTDGLGGPGYKGLFFDTPASWAPEWVAAFDLYTPGDVFPTDETMLPIASWQATRHIWVFVPPSGLGHFGMAFDDGPVLLLADGSYIGSAFDSAAFDGFAVTARALYLAAYQAIRRLKLAGVAITMVRDEDLLTPC